MFDWWWIGVLLLGAGILILVLSLLPGRGLGSRIHLADARRLFHIQRERLEAKFLALAAVHTKPGAPLWSDCDFEDDVAYVRNRASGELSAFVGVTITLDDPDGLFTQSDEGGATRIGTAVFRFDRTKWETDGTALMNLTPTEAIRYYRRDLEVVDQEVAG